VNNIGTFARNLITTRPELSNQEMVDLVKAEFPKAQTTLACIAWYKSDINKKKKSGLLVEAAPVERTLEVIQAELEAAKLRVTELEGELEVKKQASREEKLAQLEKLKQELGLE